MDATSVIAIAGLATALLGTLTVPLLQSHFTGRRETGARMDERRHAAYIDAITYAQVVEERLTEFTEDPVTRTDRGTREKPDAAMIRAKLVLVAPSAVTLAFDEVVSAWDDLCWVLGEDGPDAHGEYFVKRDDRNVVRVAKALDALKGGVRSKSLGELPGSLS